MNCQKCDNTIRTKHVTLRSQIDGIHIFFHACCDTCNLKTKRAHSKAQAIRWFMQGNFANQKKDTISESLF